MEPIKKGFTLIEMLVAVAILGLVVLASTSLFFTALKGKRKTESLVIIKQSGDYALQVMTKKIRNAQDLPSCSSNQINITNPDNSSTTFECETALCSTGIEYDGTCLVSENLQAGSCGFSCSPLANPPTAIIDFTLEIGSSSDPIGHVFQQFKTLVSLRTYQ